MLLPQVVSDCQSLVSFHLLVKVSAHVGDITCIVHVTLKMIHNALLIHKGWLVFPHFDFILDLFVDLTVHQGLYVIWTLRFLISDL